MHLFLNQFSNQMKSQVTRFFSLAVFLGFAVFFDNSNTLQAQDIPKVTAQDVTIDGVVDKDKLKSFVTWATSEYAKITDLDAGLATLQDLYRDSTDYHSGEIYLMLLRSDGGLGEGLIVFHGKNPQLNSTPILNQEDGEGKEVIKEMLKATEDEAMEVEYCKYEDPDNPSDCTKMSSFAMRYSPPTILGVDFVVVGGYSQDLSNLCMPRTDIEYPETSADEVIDRETLKSFVNGATDWIQDIYEKEGFIFASQLACQFRIDAEEGGHFKDGSIYLYVMTEQGYLFFHSLDPFREGRQVYNNTDLRGNVFIPDLVEKAKMGGGFVDYYWNNQDDPNDDEEGTLRTAYANAFNVPGFFQGDPDLIIAGAFFPSVSTAVEDEAGELPSEFVLHGNYPNPFNPSTRIQFDVHEKSKVALQVIDLLGRELVTLPSQDFDAGSGQSIGFNASNLNSGTYLYRLIVTGVEDRQYVKTGLMTLIK